MGRKRGLPPEPLVQKPGGGLENMPLPPRRQRSGSTSQGNPLGPIRGCGGGRRDDAGDMGEVDDPPITSGMRVPSHEHNRMGTKEKLDANWRKSGPQMRSDILSMAPQYALWHQKECAAQKIRLRSRIDSAFNFHTMHCDKCNEQPQMINSYQATYVGDGLSFPLTVPAWKCFGCQKEFLPQPVHVGCFGSTPVRPHTWFDLKLFSQYTVLFRHGTSCTSFVESLNSSSSFLGVHGGPALDPECFQGAYFAFRRLTDQLTSLKGLGVAVDASPLHVCPVCSPQPDEESPYAVSIAMDVNKCNHMAHAGNDIELEPHIHNFFNKGEQEVVELERKGCLDSTKSFRQHTTANEEDDEEMLLKHVVKECPSVKQVYIDFGCRLAKSWARYIQVLDGEVPASALEVKVLVNWMHAASHDMSCQLENSGRFQKDAAFVVGEQSEQLFAVTKDSAGLTRCMTHQNRHDQMESLLSDINDGKLMRLVSILKAKWDIMHKKLAELDICLQTLVAEGCAAGIPDLAVAAQEFLDSQLATSTLSSVKRLDEAEYVRLREMDLAVQNLESIGFTWKDAGGLSPVALLLRGSTHKEQKELPAKLAALERKLQIPPGNIWRVESEDYTRAYKFLAQQQISRLQNSIDILVHELAQKAIEKRQLGETCQLTQALASKMRKLHLKLRSTLEEMYAWMEAESDDVDADVRLPQSAVDAMLQGDPAPWHVGSQSSGLSLMLGRRFFMARNDRERCLEQLSILPVEKKRLVKWLDAMVERVKESKEAVQSELSVHTQSELCVHAGDGMPSYPWHLRRQHGMSFWLQWHASRLAAMQDEVNGKLPVLFDLEEILLSLLGFVVVNLVLP